MNFPQFVIIFCLRIYRSCLSPMKVFLFGPVGQCRFSPTCSCYAMDAVKNHGAVKGSWLALRRLGKCHPWGPAGYDPVPPPVSRRQSVTSSSVSLASHGS